MSRGNSWQRRIGLQIVVGLILLLAAFLRLWNLDSSAFTYDDARVSNLAATFVETGQPPVTGMVSSVGIQNPPLFAYLLSLPNLINRNPITELAFIALCNVAAVLGCYGLGRRYWGTGVGVLAMLLLAVSPWAIERSRSVIAQDLLIPGATLVLGCLFAWLVAGKRWALTAALIVSTALTQIHFAALALFPLVAILLLSQLVQCLARRRPVLFWKPLWIGLAASALLYVPYIISDAQRQWENGARLLAILQAPSRWHWDVFDMLLLHIGGRNIHSLAGPARFREFLNSIVDLAYWPDRIEEALAALAAICLVIRCWRAWRKSTRMMPELLLVLSIAVPLSLFIRSKSDVFSYYLNLVYPSIYLVLAIAARDLLATVSARLRRPILLTTTALIPLAFVVVWQAYLSVSIYSFINTHNTPGGKGTPVRILNDVTRTVESLREADGSQQFLVLCPGSEPRWEECPAVFDYLIGHSPNIRFMDYNDPLLWSHRDDENTLVLLAPGASRAAVELPQFAQSLPDQSVPLREGVGEYRFYVIHNYYRDVARYLETVGRTGDAIVLVGSGQRDLLQAEYHQGLPIYQLPDDGTGSTITELEHLIKQHQRLYGIFRSGETTDPAGPVHEWLLSHVYAGADIWLGTLRFVIYDTLPSSMQLSSQLDQASIQQDIQLLDYTSPPSAILAGDMIRLHLEWQASPRPRGNFSAFAQLLDDKNRIWAQRDLPLTRDGSPTSAWMPGQQAASQLGMVVPIGAPPGAYRLILGLYDPQSGKRLMQGNADHLDLGMITVGRPPISPVLAPLGTYYHREHDFSEIALLGFNRAVVSAGNAGDSSLHPGDVLHLSLYWRARVQPTEDWMVRLCLVDQRGKRAQCMDDQLAVARYPTSHWVAGELLRGEYTLPLSSDLPAGRYDLELSLLGGSSRQDNQWVDLGVVLLSVKD